MVNKSDVLIISIKMALILLVIVLPIWMASGYAQEDPFETVEVMDLAALVGEDYLLYGRALSPNGEMLAWFDIDPVRLCIYIFDVDEVNCHQVGMSELYLDWVNLAKLHWSSDSQYLAISQDSLASAPLIDTDIWLFEPATGSFENLTEDLFDSIIWEDVPNGTPIVSDAPIDFLSFWAPDNNALHFFRTYAIPQDEYYEFEDLQLYRLSLSDPEPELVFDFDNQFEVYDIQVAFPPDGNSIVMYLLTATDSGESPSGDLWIFDLASETFRHLVSVDEFLVGMPEDVTRIFVLGGAILPLPNTSSGIIFSATGRDESVPESVRNFYYVDLESGTITPLLNVVEQENDTFKGIQDRYRPIVAIPQSNANNLLLMYAKEPWGAYYMSSISLPPSEVSMSNSYSVEADFHPPLDTPLFGMSTNGRAMVGISLVEVK